MNTDDRRYLKIKIKHLAAEAGIIRHEERQTSGMEKWKLQDHRKTRVRSAARQAQFAYGIIRGRSLSQVARGYKPPDMFQAARDNKEVLRMVMKYGGFDFRVRKDTEKHTKEWFNETTSTTESVLEEHRSLPSVPEAPAKFHHALGPLMHRLQARG